MVSGWKSSPLNSSWLKSSWLRTSWLKSMASRPWHSNEKIAPCSSLTQDLRPQLLLSFDFALSSCPALRIRCYRSPWFCGVRLSGSQRCRNRTMGNSGGGEICWQVLRSRSSSDVEREKNNYKKDKCSLQRCMGSGLVCVNPRKILMAVVQKRLDEGFLFLNWSPE